MARKGGALLLVGLGIALGVAGAVAVPIVRDPITTGEPRVSEAECLPESRPSPAASTPIRRVPSCAM